jgi:hypothetical protein
MCQKATRRLFPQINEITYMSTLVSKELTSESKNSKINVGEDTPASALRKQDDLKKAKPQRRQFKQLSSY